MTEIYNFNFDTTYTDLPEEFFTRNRPERPYNPEIFELNKNFAREIGLNLSSSTQKELAYLFSGNYLPSGSDPLSQAYSGHQFGYFTSLGDGRAHLLGEHITPSGNRLDIQFKGSGQTPYSRNGDGKATLGPMIREYIVSEAMHNLGIPTTRSLAITTTGEEIRRERLLPGAILTRVASSHIRVGTFEFAANQKDKSKIETLLDYTIQRHFPEVMECSNKAIGLIEAVMEKQLDLIVNWMRVGFIHGVMNTDNMTLSGETIDYGPCAFMDTYDPKTVFSSIDKVGRYSFANQPQIAQWNLARLTESLVPLIDNNIDKAIKYAEKLINEFPNLYKQKWLSMMRAKIGLLDDHLGDEELIRDLLEWMENNEADYTNTFNDLTEGIILSDRNYSQSSFHTWHDKWKRRIKKNRKPWNLLVSSMNNANPFIIPRNHQVEKAINHAIAGDLKYFRDLSDALQNPYKVDSKLKCYQKPPNPRERVYQTFCGT